MAYLLQENGHSAPLSDRAIAVRCYIQQPSFRKTDRNIARRVAAETGGDPAMHTHSRMLLAKAALKKVVSIVSDARQYHYSHTLPWEDDGVRILPTAMFEEYMATMRKFEREWETEISIFVVNYPALIMEARTLLGDTFDEADYPHPTSIRERFAFRVKSNEINTDFRCSTISEEEQEAIRLDIQNRVQEALAGTVRDLFEQTKDHVAHMVERLHAYNEREAKALDEQDLTGTFRDSLVNNIREFVERLSKLNITNDPRIEEMRVKLLEKLCSHTPQQLRRFPEVRNSVLREAEAILKTTDELI